MDAYGYSKVKDKISLSENIRLYGIFDERLRALIPGLFERLDMRTLADWFRLTLDPFAAGEFYGKIMRAACLICKYTGDAGLRKIIDDAVKDMISIQADDGNISTTPRKAQPNGTNGSDLWERKYVLLGLWEYFSAFGDIDVFYAMMKLALYTASQVGEKPKTPVTETGWAFCGIESSSILEPVMKLYNMTGNCKLLELGRHIVTRGCCARENIFEAVLNGKTPMEIGSNGNPKESIAKAYEMMSCFEGLLEYYRATGEEKWFVCAGKFIDAVNANEITYLGSGGADKPYNLGPGTGEQWNNTFFEQANPDITLSMETCVTITYMKLMLQYYRLTANASYIDKIEVSAYNALLGAMRADGSFFDYFPKFNGTRSTKVNFSYDINGFPLSCCTANGPMGMGILPGLTVCRGENTAYVNMFIPFDAECKGFGRILLRTDYPAHGKLTFTVEPEKDAEYSVAVRIPCFCTGFSCSLAYVQRDGYAVITRTWKKGDAFEVGFEIPLVCHRSPESINPLTKQLYICTYGALVMSRDKSYDSDFDKPVNLFEGKITDFEFEDGEPFRIVTKGMTLIPYAYAGESWDEKTEYRSWLKSVVHC